MENFYNFSLEKLENYLERNGVKPSRAKIAFKEIYQKGRNDFSLCEEINAKTADRLNELLAVPKLEMCRKNEDKDVCKLLFRLHDGHMIESVIMRHDFGSSVCVSSQVGCNMGCAFCESGRLKKVRNLETAEIVLQAVHAARECGNLTNIVIMGIGEPFDNFDAVMDFISIATSPFGMNIGPRHVTVSTSGLVPQIDRFSELKSPCSLAISLHAPDDETRNRIMKINQAYPLGMLMKSVRSYSERNNKRVTFEYILLDGINDSPAHADRLAELLCGLKCYVNLIPYNETENIDFRKSSKERITAFYERLKSHGVWVTIRHEFGSEIKAACGQLRAEYGENGG